MTSPSSQAKIHIERMMYRSSIAVQGESAASYALVKLIPSGGGASKRLNRSRVVAVTEAPSSRQCDSPREYTCVKSVAGSIAAHRSYGSKK